MIKRLILRLVILAIAFGITTGTLTPASATPVNPCVGGTLGYWPMDEGTGNIVHDICNGFNGSFSQGVAWATDAEGPYLQFSTGDGPRVEVNAPALSQNTAITVELRMQAVANDASRVISQVLKSDGTKGALRWTLKHEGRQLEVWGATGSNNTPESFGSFPGGLNNWTHVAFQINGNQVFLYYDGVLTAQRTLNFPQTLRSLAAITEFGAMERIFGFGGKIQYVRISNGIRNDFLLTRIPTNQSPTADAGGAYTVEEGGSVILNGSASNDPDSDPLTFAWDLDNDSTFETSGQTPTFSAVDRDGPDSQLVVLRVCDPSSACDTESTTVSINNASPVISSVTNDGPISEGSSATIAVTASDPAGAKDPPSYEFDCDNDSSYEIGPQPGNAADCTFGDNGSFQINVRVMDGDGGEDTDFTIVAVNNVPPSVDGPTVDPSPSDEGSSVIVTAIFSDPGSNDTPFTCMVNYGDGSGNFPGTVAGNTCTGPTHTYDDDGINTVTISITDKDGDVGIGAAAHVVNNVAPTVDAGANAIIGVGKIFEVSATFTDPGILDTQTATIDFGDGAGPQPATVIEDAGSGTVTGSTKYVGPPATYIIEVCVTDNNLDTGCDQLMLNVVAGPPPEPPGPPFEPPGPPPGPPGMP